MLLPDINVLVCAHRALSISRSSSSCASGQTETFEVDGDYFFLYEGRRVPLSVRDDLFFVRSLDSTPPEQLRQDVLSEATGWHAAAAGRWSLFSLASASSPPELRADSALAINNVINRFLGRYWLSPVFVDSAGGELLVPPEVTVGFTLDVDDGEAIAVLEEAGYEITGRLLGRRSKFTVRHPTAHTAFDALWAANRAAAIRGVQWAEPDFHVLTARPQSHDCQPVNPTLPDQDPITPGEQYWPFNGTWGINLEPAWQICGGGDASGDPIVVVGVIDEGMDLDHLEVRRAGNGQNFAQDLPQWPTPYPAWHAHDNDIQALGVPTNCEHHGTQVAGVVAMIDNGTGGVQTLGVESCPRVPFSPRAPTTGSGEASIVGSPPTR